MNCYRRWTGSLHSYVLAWPLTSRITNHPRWSLEKTLVSSINPSESRCIKRILDTNNCTKHASLRYTFTYCTNILNHNDIFTKWISEHYKYCKYCKYCKYYKYYKYCKYYKYWIYWIYWKYWKYWIYTINFIAIFD